MEALLVRAASLQGGWGRIALSQSPKSRISGFGQKLLQLRALRIGDTFEELSVFFSYTTRKKWFILANAPGIQKPVIPAFAVCALIPVLPTTPIR
jgi:hypothetical protein